MTPRPGRATGMTTTRRRRRRAWSRSPATNTRRTVAENLPIGRTGSPGFPPPNIATGVAVGADGTIYFSANKNNAIYRVRPMR